MPVMWYTKSAQKRLINMESNNSVNTPQQWACKFDSFLFNEYEFTPQELDELQADRQRQIRRETS